MLHMNKNGIQKIIKRAYEILKEEHYLKLDPVEQQNYCD